MAATAGKLRRPSLECLDGWKPTKAQFHMHVPDQQQSPGFVFATARRKSEPANPGLTSGLPRGEQRPRKWFLERTVSAAASIGGKSGSGSGRRPLVGPKTSPIKRTPCETGF
jgi:hypothetical protein